MFFGCNFFWWCLYNFFIYWIVSITNMDILTTSFPTYSLFSSFICLISVAMTSCTTLNREWDIALFINLVKMLFCPTSKMLVIDLLYTDFYLVKIYFVLFLILWGFYHKEMLYFYPNPFLYLEMIILFLFLSLFMKWITILIYLSWAISASLSK